MFEAARLRHQTQPDQPLPTLAFLGSRTPSRQSEILMTNAQTLHLISATAMVVLLAVDLVWDDIIDRKSRSFAQTVWLAASYHLSLLRIGRRVAWRISRSLRRCSTPGDHEQVLFAVTLWYGFISLLISIIIAVALIDYTRLAEIGRDARFPGWLYPLSLIVHLVHHAMQLMIGAAGFATASEIALAAKRVKTLPTAIGLVAAWCAVSAIFSLISWCLISIELWLSGWESSIPLIVDISLPIVVAVSIGFAPLFFSLTVLVAVFLAGLVRFTVIVGLNALRRFAESRRRIINLSCFLCIAIVNLLVAIYAS